MKKRLAIFIIFSLLVVSYALSILQPHRNFYPVIEIEMIDNTEPVTLGFQFNKLPTLRNCETLTGNIARVVFKTCPQCRIKSIQCDDTLDEAQQALLTNAPLATVSGRMANGNIIFHAANTEVALAACQATATQSARKNNPVECFAANTTRTTSTTTMTLSPETWLLLFAAFFVTWFTVWFIVKYEHLHAHLSHDHVNTGPQKYHTEPTPRIGGIAIMSGLLAAIGSMLLVDMPSKDEFGLLLLAGIPTFLGGLVEDITKRVGVLERLLITMLSGTIAAWLLGTVLNRLGIPGIDQALLWLPFAVIFTSFAVGGIANAINIIDGYNGLASGYTVIVLIAFACVAYLVGDNLVFSIALSLAGALLGFFVWNWPIGKIFMGDGGAYLVGFLLAELSIILVARNPDVSPWFPLLLLIYPVFETLFSAYRRKLKNGLSPGQPDNMHLHQLIHDNVILRRENVRANNTNSRVAKYLWIPAIATALLGCIFWQSTMMLIAITAAYCIGYVVIYRRIAQLKSKPGELTTTSLLGN